MLSLSPRFDLFHFEFKKDYFPKEILEKYSQILNDNVSVFVDPVSYLNESIQGISIPGLDSLTQVEQLHSTNPNRRMSGHFNVEPSYENNYVSIDNPLAKVDRTFKVVMRQNQGLINYYMMYETIFHKICKDKLHTGGDDVFTIDFLDNNGKIISQLKLFQVLVDSIGGLEFSYSKAIQEFETFEVGFKFNNLDFDFIK